MTASGAALYKYWPISHHQNCTLEALLANLEKVGAEGWPSELQNVSNQGAELIVQFILFGSPESDDRDF